MTPGFEVVETTQHGVARLLVSGELDASTEPDLRAVAQRVLLDRPAALEVDLSGVTFCDGSGAHGLAFLQVEAESFGVRYRIVEVSGPVRRVLALAGLDRCLPLAARDPGAAGPAERPEGGEGGEDVAGAGAGAVLDGLFRVGLGVRSAARGTADPAVAGALQAATDELDRAIARLQLAAFEQHPRTPAGEPGDREAPSVLERATSALRASLAHATRNPTGSRTQIVVSAGETLTIEVVDDGPGPGPDPMRPGSDLAHAAAEARRLGGDLDLRPSPRGGTALTWWVPMPAAAAGGGGGR